MTEDKLTKFLAKSGLIKTNNPVPQINPPKDNQPPQSHPPRKQAPHTAQKPGPFPQKSGNTAPRKKSFGARPMGMNSAPTNYDPNFARPTFEKREKFHPTNYLNTPKNAGIIKVVPLGGLEQVGQNMMFIEWENDIIIIDTGLNFPSPEHLGVDILVPNISYLIERKNKIRGVLYTHGHLDHIGGAPYLIRDLGFPPMFATRLTKELLLAHSDHPEVVNNYKITEINVKTKLKLGKFEVEFFHINHSIPDGVGIVVNTPYGAIVHTSDFKFDSNPSDDQPADLGHIAYIGSRGVALALVDSTNALKSGHTLSESVIEGELAKTIQQTSGRIVLATFASNIGRIAKIVEAAEKYGRTVFISGRSMERNLGIAKKLNYLKCKEKTIQQMSKAASKIDPNKTLVLCTGSQGEELAALTRMAAGTHRDVKLSPEDTVIFSSSPIPGNEMAIVSVLNNLADLGVKTFDNKQLDSHVSGHGHAEECKLMTSLLNPKYFSPIHGELFMRYGHRDMIVQSLGIKKENTFVMKNGKGIILSPQGARLMTDKEAIPAANVLIELGEQIGEHVLAERTMMADGGIILVAIKQIDGKAKSIKITARGFRYMGQKHEVFQLLQTEMKNVFERNYDPARPESVIEEVMTTSAQKFLWQKYKKETLVEVVLV
jgi:ribonuclease J